MTQLTSKLIQTFNAKTWLSLICACIGTLATTACFAEQSTRSLDIVGFLWFSPETADLESHVAKATALTGVTTASQKTTKNSSETDELEVVFGDVLQEIGLLTKPKIDDATDAEELATDAEELAADTKEPATDAEELAADTKEPATDAEELAAEESSDKVQRYITKFQISVTDEPTDESSELAITSSKDTQPPARVIPARVANLRRPIENCLRVYEPKVLNSGEHSCWSMMHSFLGWGVDSQIRIGSEKGRRTNVLKWLCTNQACAGRRLFYVSDGRIKGREGPGYQGHAGQFLAMAAQTHTPREYAIRAQGNDFTIDELVKEEQLTCREPMELTFKLIGFSHYLNTDAKWKNDRGEKWNIPRLIRAELAQPVNGAACGGTHRVMGLTYAIKKRKEAQKPVEGQWWRAEKFVNDYYNYAMSLQNRDGSFSSDWFKRKSNWGGKDRKLQTTGHILEWLVFASSEEQLLDDRITRSVAFLTNLMVQHRYHDWEYGPKGHAVRAIRLYHERVFESDWKQPATLVRRGNKSTPSRRSKRRR
ncbi:MAG: hypothetical protein GY768_04135 [Planctomycetaceae bacterium]|nr:hypothetical protein [Planctomycetaceae bacterium]